MRKRNGFGIAASIVSLFGLMGAEGGSCGEGLDLSGIEGAEVDINVHPGQAEVLGRVVDQVTGEGIVNATVEIAGLSAGTDGAGVFIVVEVPAGEHLLTASAPGYVSTTVAVQLEAGVNELPTPIQLVDDTSPQILGDGSHTVAYRLQGTQFGLPANSWVVRQVEVVPTEGASASWVETVYVDEPGSSGRVRADVVCKRTADSQWAVVDLDRESVALHVVSDTCFGTAGQDLTVLWDLAVGQVPTGIFWVMQSRVDESIPPMLHAGGIAVPLYQSCVGTGDRPYCDALCDLSDDGALSGLECPLVADYSTYPEHRLNNSIYRLEGTSFGLTADAWVAAMFTIAPRSATEALWIERMILANPGTSGHAVGEVLCEKRANSVWSDVFAGGRQQVVLTIAIDTCTGLAAGATMTYLLEGAGTSNPNDLLLWPMAANAAEDPSTLLHEGGTATVIEACYWPDGSGDALYCGGSCDLHADGDLSGDPEWCPFLEVVE